MEICNLFAVYFCGSRDNVDLLAAVIDVYSDHVIAFTKGLSRVLLVLCVGVRYHRGGVLSYTVDIVHILQCTL